ncbi:nucleotidyltransferase family protein [Pseudomonas aeruginosa]
MRASEKVAGKGALILQITAAHGFSYPRIFGSVAKGLDHEDSDVDILVDPPISKINMLHVGRLQYELEEALGLPVDLKLESFLPDYSREAILAMAIPVTPEYP